MPRHLPASLAITVADYATRPDGSSTVRYALTNADCQEVARTSGAFDIITETKHANILAAAGRLLFVGTEMRRAQRIHTKAHTRETLTTARALEKEFDRLLSSLSLIRLSDLGLSGVSGPEPEPTDPDSVVDQLTRIATDLEDFRNLPQCRNRLHTLAHSLSSHSLSKH